MHLQPYSALCPAACEDLKVCTVHPGQHWSINVNMVWKIHVCRTGYYFCCWCQYGTKQCPYCYEKLFFAYCH